MHMALHADWRIYVMYNMQVYKHFIYYACPVALIKNFMSMPTLMKPFEDFVILKKT